MTVLVTGAAGLLGRRVLAKLSEAGSRTRALAHRRDVEGADEIVWGALDDPSSLRAATEGASAVLHLAARTHARRDVEYRRANVEGTAALLDAAVASGVGRFVHVSSRAVSPQGGAYSRSKLDAEALVRAAALDHVIVRLPEVYGTGGREGMDDMLARAQAGAFIPVIGKGLDRLCPVHVGDVIGPLTAALASPAAVGHTYTLAGECLSHREIAHMCSVAFGGRSRLVSVPTAAVAVAGAFGRVLPLPVYPDQLARLRSEKPAASPEAEADLGFRPRGLDEGLRLAVASGV
jgi:NADH dehydrogenase